MNISLKPGTVPILDDGPLSADVERSITDSAHCEFKEESSSSLLVQLVSNSPFLCGLAKRYPGAVADMMNNGYDSAFDKILSSLSEPRPANESEDEFSTFLREQKNKAALLIALADLAGSWPLEAVTEKLSHLASMCLELSIAKALSKRMRMGELPWPDNASPDHPVTLELNKSCGFFILGLGKLGAHELNYSSDIDLIALYDPARISYTGRKSISDCFIKLTQDVVRYMDQRTVYGYVFRVDLRLRPDPGATPVALSVDAALGYYHSIAANWERSAMIKASFAAGDQSAAEQYLQEMSSRITGLRN